MIKTVSKNLSKLLHFLETHEWITLGIILLIGLAFRVYNLKDNIIFAYDQARDAQRVFDIVYNKDIKIVGPETDIPGVFNGPLLYYMLALVYSISHFNPNTAALMFVLINLTGVVIIYHSAKVLFDNKKVAYISAFLWAISYAQLNFARFISNASPMSISSLIFFYGLALFIFRKKNSGLFISAVGLAAAVQFNFYLIYLAIFYPIFYVIYQPKLSWKPVFYTAIILGVLLSSFAISELQWKFAATKSLLAYFGHQSSISSVLENISRYLQRTTEAIYYSFFSINVFLAFLLFSFLLILAWNTEKKRDRLVFLLIWMFSTLPLFSFSSGVLNGIVISSTIFAPILIICALGIGHLLEQKKYVLIGLGIILVALISNLILMKKDNFQQIKLFAMQPLLLKHEKELVDYTYKEAKGQPFSICGVTNPLFINTLWSQLYFSYGEKKYGYLPTWAGQPQYLNKSVLPYDTSHVKTRFFIIEPLGGIPSYSLLASVYQEDQTSVLDDEKKFGDITVQKRHLDPDKTKLKPSMNLAPGEISNIQRVIKADPRYSCYVQY